MEISAVRSAAVTDDNDDDSDDDISKHLPSLAAIVSEQQLSEIISSVSM